MNDRIRDQFIRDEIAKAEKQDAEFFSHQTHINRRRMRRDLLRILGPDLTIAAAIIGLIFIWAIMHGWI